MRAALAASCLGLLAAGCMMGPDYHRPAVDAPASYRFAPKQAASTADTDWWKQLGDPVLDQLVGEALAHNKDLMIATANVEQSAAVLMQTRSPLFPQLSYAGDGGRYRFSENSTTTLPSGVSNPTNYYNALGGVSWEIDLWGRIRRLTQAARANLLATEDARRGVVLTLIAQVTTSYVQLRALDEELAIADRTLETYGASLKVARDKFEFGQVSQMNVAQVESQYQTVAARIPELKNDIVITENALSILVGRNPGSIVRGKALGEFSVLSVPEGLPSQLLERRPDILEAEQQLVAATAQIGAAKALFFPQISLTGRYGNASTHLHELFTGPTRQWSYLGNFTGPIFSGGDVLGQVRQATAAQKAALANYQRAIQHGFADVDQALSSREQLTAQVDAERLLVKSLKDYSELARLQYEAGYAPYSTVLQAEEQLFPQELKLAQDQGALLGAYVDIYRAMGGAWVTNAAR